jgi:alcohol dehydrogenase class IV
MTNLTWRDRKMPDRKALSAVVVHETRAGRVLIGPGARDLVADEAVRLGAGWLAGICLAQTRMGLHHQLAHVLGGAFDLPHAELHTLLLPHVMAFNLPSAPAAAARLGRIAGPDPAGVVSGLARAHEGPTTLDALGVPRPELRRVAERVVAQPYPNPRPLDVESVAALLDAAW